MVELQRKQRAAEDRGGETLVWRILINETNYVLETV